MESTWINHLGVGVCEDGVHENFTTHWGCVFADPPSTGIHGIMTQDVCLSENMVLKNHNKPMVYQHVSPLKGAFGEYTIREFYPTNANNVCFGSIVSLASVDQFTRASASLLCWWGHTPCHWTWVWDSCCVQVLFYPNTSITNLQKLICFSFSLVFSMFKPPEPAEALVFSLRNDQITGDLSALARFPCLLLEGERVSMGLWVKGGHTRRGKYRPFWGQKWENRWN